MNYDVTEDTLRHYVQQNAQLQLDLIQARLVIQRLEAEKAGEAGDAAA